jgi:aminomethyltransferase
VRADQRCCHRHFFNAACQFSTRVKGPLCSAGAENSGPARLVDFKMDHFIGRLTLEEEQRRGPKRLLTWFAINWDDVERLYDAIGLAPQVPSMASRMAVPVYRGGFQVGKATSTTWSPLLERMIELASVSREHAAPGTEPHMELTMEVARHTVRATTRELPFFNPPRKTATPIV